MTASLAAGLPTECMAGTFQSHGWLALAATILGLLGAIYSLSRGFLWLREEANCRHNHTTPPDHYTAKSWLLGMWVL
ncbi:MAG TPA: hypothetical protein VL495_02630, partial [Edaphobacter sp.]|nr:hypothetical protein [Edaphobacter sp.]